MFRHKPSDKKFDIQINNSVWSVWIVKKIYEDDDENGKMAIGQANNAFYTIKFRDGLSFSVLKKVVVHEVVHAFFESYALRDTKGKYDEEKICDIFSCYAEEVLKVSEEVFEKLVKAGYKGG